MKKSVITLASYDAHMLPSSIKSYYSFVDEIIIGLDKDRITWSNNPFTFDEDKLWEELKAIDIDNKIEIIEENFHRSEVAIENDNFERNYCKAHCSNEWIFSFDADEVLVNPVEFFVQYLPYVEKYHDKVDLTFTWMMPYKEFDDFYLMIANDDGSIFTGDTQGFTTSKYNTYTFCRWTDNQKHIKSPLAVLHWSFCRKAEEVEMKINNFGHSDKTANDPFFHNWKLVNESNYHELRNFKTHDMGGGQWFKLIKIDKNKLIPACEQAAKGLI
jgi:hypothetical protein